MTAPIMMVFHRLPVADVDHHNALVAVIHSSVRSFQA